MYIKKRFGTIYIKNMTKEIEETVLNDTMQINSLYDEVDILKNNIKYKDIEIKNLKEDVKLLKDKNEILNNIINKNNNTINKYNDDLIKNYINEKEIYINFDINNKVDIKEDIKTERLLDINKNKEVKYDILTPPQTPDKKIFKPKPAYKLFEEENKEPFYDTKDDIKINDNIKNTLEEIQPRRYTHKFENKELNILERCNVNAYNYNSKNKNSIELLDFIGTEYKVLIKFNSVVSEKINHNDKDIWNEIFKFKIDNKELTNNTKYSYKNKVLRCKEIYDKYGDSLGKFKIYVNYLGKLNDNEWKEYLIEFDKLYKNTINENDICKHKYKNDKTCNRICCNIIHKEDK